MPWWLDLVLLSLAATLWFSGGADRDDVWSLLQRLLAGVAVAVVLLGGRQIPLELLGLGLALWLPSAGSRRLSSADPSALLEGRRAQTGRPGGR